MEWRRRCNRGLEKKVQPWTGEDGATVGLEKTVQPWTGEDGATVDLGRRRNRRLEKTVLPST